METSSDEVDFSHQILSGIFVPISTELHVMSSSFFSFLWPSSSESADPGDSEPGPQDDSSESSSKPERHGERWTEEEEKRLITLMEEDHSVKDMAHQLKRSENAIRARFSQVGDDFWTISRLRQLVGATLQTSGVKEVAQDLDSPVPLVRSRMKALDLIGDTPLANLRERLLNSTAKVRFWKFKSGDFGNGTPSDCDAAWIPSREFGSDEKDLYLFSETEATIFSQLFVECYDFEGTVSRSSSGRTWNIWNIRQERFKRKVKRYRNGGNSNQSSSRRKRRRKVSSQKMSHYRRKYPELKDMDHPEHWVNLSEQLMIDPEILKSNLD